MQKLDTSELKSHKLYDLSVDGKFVTHVEWVCNRRAVRGFKERDFGFFRVTEDDVHNAAGVGNRLMAVEDGVLMLDYRRTYTSSGVCSLALSEGTTDAASRWKARQAAKREVRANERALREHVAREDRPPAPAPAPAPAADPLKETGKKGP